MACALLRQETGIQRLLQSEGKERGEGGRGGKRGEEWRVKIRGRGRGRQGRG